MQDLIYVAVMVAFFAVAALFVVACDKIIGSDEVALAEVDEHRAVDRPLVVGQRELDLVGLVAKLADADRLNPTPSRRD